MTTQTKEIEEFFKGQELGLMQQAREEMEFLIKLKKTYKMDRGIKRQISIRIDKLNNLAHILD